LFMQLSHFVATFTRQVMNWANIRRAFASQLTLSYLANHVLARLGFA